MTQSVELPVRQFCLEWSLSGAEGARVGITVSGQITLFENNRFYKIDGVLYISDGAENVRAVGNPRLFIRRNGIEESGRHWGWETCSARKTLDSLTAMDAYFIRTGYWAPADRAMKLSLGAETGWTRKKTFSPPVTVRLID